MFRLSVINMCVTGDAAAGADDDDDDEWEDVSDEDDADQPVDAKRYLSVLIPQSVYVLLCKSCRR